MFHLTNIQSNFGDGRMVRPLVDPSHKMSSPATLPRPTGAWSQQIIPISSLKPKQRKYVCCTIMI